MRANAADQAPACQTLEYYYKTGCPHCARAHDFLLTLQKSNPDLVIHRFNVADAKLGFPRFSYQNQHFGIAPPGVPMLVACERYLLGFETPETTGRELTAMLGLEPDSAATSAATTPVKLPLLGEVDVRQLGLPLFTVLVGLIDGFNPCAIWVLLFLLSLLVNLKSRARIVIVAGTFVLVSGLVYFAFMAAWLNVFLIIGFTRIMQVAVGVMSLLIGAVHIKDFFAPKKGFSLSIADTAKPGLYTRVRDVIHARTLWLSLIAVAILALFVNLIELLCTAGLPALYTHVLTAHHLGIREYYSYLLLYNLAYIFDDALMVGVVVYTLNRSKIQEKTGRLLKLVSGSVIAALGFLLIFFPEILAWRPS